MASVADISEEESIRQNLEAWCFEVGTLYEQYSVDSANKFIEYIKQEPVIDLGCGDGAATNVFVANGNPTVAVDINPHKLAEVKGATKVNEDFLTYLNRPLEHVFLHHSLEHFVNYKEVINRIAKYLKKSRYCFIAVPYNDGIHSCHHVSFDNIKDILPEGFKMIECKISQDNAWPELRVISRKV